MIDALLFFAAVVVIATAACWVGDGIGKLVEARQITKIPAARRPGGAGGGRFSTCPESRPPVFASDNATSTDVAVPGHEGGVRSSSGKLAAGHSLAVIRSYKVRDYFECGSVVPTMPHWRWRCECGDKISGFRSEAEALASHAKHQEIEAQIEVMRP